MAGSDRQIRITAEFVDKLFKQVEEGASRAHKAVQGLADAQKRFSQEGAKTKGADTGFTKAQAAADKLRGTIDRTGESMRNLMALTKRELTAVESQLLKTSTAFDRYAQAQQKAARAAQRAAPVGGGGANSSALVGAGVGIALHSGSAQLAEGADPRTGAALRAGGNIFGGAIAGAATAGPAGAVVGAVAGAIASLKDLAAAITGVELSAEEKKQKLLGKQAGSISERNAAILADSAARGTGLGLEMLRRQQGGMSDADFAGQEARFLGGQSARALAGANALDLPGNEGRAAKLDLAKEGLALALQAEQSLERQKALRLAGLQAEKQAAQVSMQASLQALENARRQADIQQNQFIGAQASFGRLDPLQQGRFKALDKKLASGEKLTFGELQEADRLGVNKERINQQFSDRGRAAGFGGTETGTELRAKAKAAQEVRQIIEEQVEIESRHIVKLEFDETKIVQNAEAVLRPIRDEMLKLMSRIQQETAAVRRGAGS